MKSAAKQKILKISLFNVGLLIAVALIIYGVSQAGTLSCTIRASTCSGGETDVLHLSALTSAHAELPSQANYTQLVCCSGVTGLGTNCSGVYGTVLKLSALTNAHVQQNSYGTYTNNACLSTGTGGTVTIAYQVSNCTGYDTTLASMSAASNAHVGDATAYTTKICGTATAGAVISVSVSDGVVTYGNVGYGSSSSTLPSEGNDSQTVTNNGDTTENFNVKGQNAPCPWTLAASAGNEQYKHEFSTSGGAGWTALTTNYQTLATGVASSTNILMDLKITVPTSTSCNNSQAVDVTVQAVQG